MFGELLTRHRLADRVSLRLGLEQRSHKLLVFLNRIVLLLFDSCVPSLIGVSSRLIRFSLRLLTLNRANVGVRSRVVVFFRKLFAAQVYPERFLDIDLSLSLLP